MLVWQMSCLDTFCISHFKERDKFSRMTEKALLLDKADFAVNGYEVDEERYPRQPDKVLSSGGNTRMRADDAMTLVLPKESSDDNDDSPMGDDDATPHPDAIDLSDDDDDEGHSEEQSIPLVGERLGAAIVTEEVNEELARARGQATSQKLFDSLSQPGSSNLRRESRPLLSSPSLPPNPKSTQRSKRIADAEDQRRQRAQDDGDAPMVVPSQASVSESPNPVTDVNLIMLNMLQKMQENQEASNKRNMDMLEQHRLDIEMRMEQQRKDMDIHMDQQRKDMAIMHEKSVQTMMNQVPIIVHNALLGVGGVMNVAPLQLKGPSSSHPPLMLTEGHPTPQGSGTSARGESIGMGKAALPHKSGHQNPKKASSLSPRHSAGVSQPSALDVDDIARSPDDSAAG
jgi:hypothetical protein